MDLSFPCTGCLDDGIFDLGLEGGQAESEGHGECVPCGTISNPGTGAACPEASSSSSPDALDLVMRAFSAVDTESTMSTAHESIEMSNGRAIPFCDAMVGQRHGGRDRSRLERVCGRMTKSPSQGLGVRAMLSSMSINSVHMQQLPHSVKHELALSAPRGPRGDSSAKPLYPHGSRQYPSTHKERSRAQATEGMKSPVSQRTSSVISRVSEDNDPCCDVDIRAAVGQGTDRIRTEGTTSIGKSDEGLARVDRAVASLVKESDITDPSRSSTTANSLKRVAFAIAPIANGTDPAEGWEEELEQAKDGELSERDIFARASELHSSVAGQLRNVNELLKRKSYVYIDTSWNARQLPRPPAEGAPLGTETTSTRVAKIHGTPAGSGRSYKARRDTRAAPADGNLTVKLAGNWASDSGKTTIVGICSITGCKAYDLDWRNQDAGVALAPLGRTKAEALFAVLDGHGTYGREAARKSMERLPKYLCSLSRSGDPASTLRRTCQRLHRDLVMGVAGDCSRSGTTLCAALLSRRRLTVASIGDSGCVRVMRSSKNTCRSSSAGTMMADPGDHIFSATAPASKRDGRDASKSGSRLETNLIVEPLSKDHKPDQLGELRRIQAAGGVVIPLPSEGQEETSDAVGVQEEHGMLEKGAGPRSAPVTPASTRKVARVWRMDGAGPGLAMSRSLGDKVAHDIGVSHVPDIVEIDLDPRKDVMLVLASDGVWDVVSHEDIRKWAGLYGVLDGDDWSPQRLSEDVCREAVARWAAVTQGRSDDVTCLVVKTSTLFPMINCAERERHTLRSGDKLS